MSILTILAQHADIAAHHISVAGSMVSDAALHGKHAIDHAGNDLVILAQSTGDISVEEFKQKLQNVQQEEQLGWLTSIGKYFIGIFQKGGEVFAGFVTGIIPTLVVLMTAFYALTRASGRRASSRYRTWRWAYRTDTLHNSAAPFGVFPYQSNGLYVRLLP